MNYNEQEIRDHYRRLTKLLIDRKYTITTMESATSGQIASLITDTEGSSAVLKGAFITYSNEAKILQGVPAETIEKYTVYSRETAEAMAAACMKAYGARIGIGVTGTMGNVDPANPDASVPGQVYFAIGMHNGIGSEDGTMSDQPVIESFHLELEPQPSRLMYKLAVAEEVYKVLIAKLA
jgi:PncC family amidohydrolase